MSIELTQPIAWDLRKERCSRSGLFGRDVTTGPYGGPAFPSMGKKIPVPNPPPHAFVNKLWAQNDTDIPNPPNLNKQNPCSVVQNWMAYTNQFGGDNEYPYPFTLVAPNGNPCSFPLIEPGFGSIDIDIPVMGVTLHVAPAEVQFFAMILYSPSGHPYFRWQLTTSSIGRVGSGIGGDPNDPDTDDDPGKWLVEGSSGLRGFPMEVSSPQYFIRFEEYPESLQIDVKKDEADGELRGVFFGRLGRVL